MAPREEPYTTQPHSRVRKAIGERVLTSVNTIPQFPLGTLVDMEPMIALRNGLKETTAPVPSHNDLIIKAVALTLRDFPRVNAWCDDESVKLLEEINIGFAVSTEQGVLLPTVREADRKSVAEIAAETRELIDLARAGKLRASLQMGAGFTISNLGPVGVDWFAPIISPPQVAILGIGSFRPYPMVANGQVVVRTAAQFTLVVDHRAIDGAEGGIFLAALADTVSHPERWAQA
ncbi:MAG: 2-oxo acid dehydrogenase subunit E2 [Armatimonadota bacterium]